jgi:hypothetical protein
MKLTKRRKLLLLIVCALLLLPVLGLWISEEVNWGLVDFIIAGVLLLGFGFLVDLACEKIQGRRARLITVLCVIVFFILVWGELAVGLFGTPWAGD